MAYLLSGDAPAKYNVFPISKLQDVMGRCILSCPACGRS